MSYRTLAQLVNCAEKKAQAFTDTLFNLVGGREQFDEVRTDLHRTDKENPNSNEEAMATLSLSVKSKDPDLVGRLFSAKIVELFRRDHRQWLFRRARCQ